MRITSKNLDETVRLNQQIKKEIEKHLSLVYKMHDDYDILSPEKQAAQILKENYLIQIPIPDKDWGGALKELPNGLMVPVINTAQPRVYQYFIYWHEIYHLLDKRLSQSTEHIQLSHDISTEFDLTERKADYFASQMLMGDKIYTFYYRYFKNQKSFIDRIAICMDAFKSPYKAVLIQLYETAIQHQDDDFREEIIEHFDCLVDWNAKFIELSLDNSLVKPSNIVDFGLLKNLVDKQNNEFPDDRALSETRDFILLLETKYLDVKGTLDIGEL